MGHEFIDFPFLRSNHRRSVPVITVRVGVSRAEEAAAAEAGIDLPRVHPIEADALVDTGAYRSFIPADFVERLGLFPRDVVEVSQPLGETVRVHLYDVSFEILAQKKRGTGWRSVGFAENARAGVLPDRGSTGPRRFPMPILGRDVLDRCFFNYNGPGSLLGLRVQRRPRRAR